MSIWVNRPGFKLKTDYKPDAVVCSETYCPMSRLRMQVDVQSIAQQDGRGWSAEHVIRAEDELVEEIVAALRVKVEEFVKRQVKPYHCMCFTEVERNKLKEHDMEITDEEKGHR